MPLDFNGAVVTTDELGAFAVILKDNNEYKISSGLPANLGGVAAISFADILESGASLAERSPVIIPMQRNVRLDGPVCRVLRNDAIELAFFPYENTTSSIPGLPDGVQIEVPLIYNKLNQIFSPIDNPNPAPVPETLFAIGMQGFARELSAFATSTGTYAVTWNFLGEQAIIDGALKICADRGISEPCTPTDEQALKEIWIYTSKIIINQIINSHKLATNKTWRPDPANRLVIINRGSAVLAALRQQISTYYNTYTCQVLTAECRTIKVDKKKINALFNRLYKKTPKGLESLHNDKVERKKGLLDLLNKLPKNVASCD
ncbi:MAG: hypothetical protein NTV65_07515 [Proteobacteria bacterium]|nr:hypothetical protein [Pseudomonadota bacterium]